MTRPLNSGPDVVRHLGHQVAHAVREAALPGRAREAGLDRLDDPRRAVGDHQQGIPEATLAHVLEERADRLRILLRARHQVQQDLLPAAVKPQAASTGSRLLPGRIRSATPSMNR